MVVMKKLHNSRGAEPTTEASESVKKLYKSINEVSHFLDDQRGRSLTCKDLFTVAVDTQRMKLKNYCERMMLADPLCYGRKAEDIMWRKTYHDVYSTAKILRKNNDWNHVELALIENHFQSGIGSYYHLLFKFQAEIKFNRPELFDFYLLINDDTDNNVKKDHITLLKKNDNSNKEETGIKQLVYRCLICLGDLSRYMYELNKLDLYYSTACRYYKQALNYKPANGLPHNQIGRLALSNNKHLDAVYHYVRCVFSIEPFEGGEKNLILSLQQQSEPVGNVFLEKLLSVFNLWYTGKDNGQELDKIYSSIISILQNFDDFKNKINGTDKKKEINKEDTITPLVKDTVQFFSNNENIFKIVVIIIAFLNKLHKEDFKYIPKAELFFLTFMEHLIGQSVTYCVKTLPLLVNPNIDHTKLNRRRRRRGFRQHSSPDSQEWSGDEAESIISPDDESDNESEEEMLIFDMKRPNDDKSKNESDGSNDSGTSSFGCENKNNPKSRYSNIPFIETIKIYFDWIQSNIDSLNREASVEFFNNTVTLLNYLSQANIEDTFLDININQFLLPEEVHLRGMTVFSKSKKYCGEYDRNICTKNEGTIRLIHMLHCAEEIASNNILFTYDKIKKWFSICDTLKQTDEKSLKDAKRDKQHVMGQLWLRSEVDNLEYKIKYSSRKKSLPTCIVIDTDALINYSLIIKKLVNSTKFIVVVPAIVISALDEQKKLSKEVRLTIRWLEFQLQEGNCNLKSQGIHETLPIKLDGPPKLSKEICNFKHILECCNYFKGEYGENTGIVTLLTGSDDLLESSELMEMAKSVKINIEHIKTFQFQLKTVKNKG